MLISIISKNIISEDEIQYMIKYYEGMVVIPISNYHIIVRDANVYDVTSATEYYSYSFNTLKDYFYKVEMMKNVA